MLEDLGWNLELLVSNLKGSDLQSEEIERVSTGGCYPKTSHLT